MNDFEYRVTIEYSDYVQTILDRYRTKLRHAEIVYQMSNNPNRGKILHYHQMEYLTAKMVVNTTYGYATY
jgi:hypothetical protein